MNINNLKHFDFQKEGKYTKQFGDVRNYVGTHVTC